MKKFFILSIALISAASYAQNDIALKNFEKIFIKNHNISPENLAKELEDFMQQYQGLTFKAMSDQEIQKIKNDYSQKLAKKYNQQLIAKNKQCSKLREQLALVQSALKNQNDGMPPSLSDAELQRLEAEINKDHAEEMPNACLNDAERQRLEAGLQNEPTLSPKEEQIIDQPGGQRPSSENDALNVLSKDTPTTPSNTTQSKECMPQGSFAERMKQKLIQALKNAAISSRDWAIRGIKRAAVKAKDCSIQLAKDQKTRLQSGLRAFWKAYRAPLN